MSAKRGPHPFNGNTCVTGPVPDGLTETQQQDQFRAENSIPWWVPVRITYTPGVYGKAKGWFAYAEWSEEDERQRRLAKADQE